MHLYLMRHGEAEHNVDRTLSANPKRRSNLTAAGKKQAAKMAKKLETTTLEVIFISELARTQQTADIINRDRGLPTIVDARLNELNIGFEGQTHSEWLAARKVSEDEWTSSVEGAESLADGLQRTQEFIDDLAQESYRHVAVVTHGFIVMGIQSIIEGFSLKQAYAKHHDPGANVAHGEVIELSLT